MQILISRSGLVLNPGQMADLVLAWRQVAGLIAAIPANRPMADDFAYSFRLHPPGVPTVAATPAAAAAGAAPRAASKATADASPARKASPAAPSRKQAPPSRQPVASKPKRKAAAKPARKPAPRRAKSRR